MDKLRTDRLLKLAEHLEKGKLAHARFDFNFINACVAPGAYDARGCGTAGCAMGELPAVFPGYWVFPVGPVAVGASRAPRLVNPRSSVFNEEVEGFFGLTGVELYFLFYPAKEGMLGNPEDGHYRAIFGVPRLRHSARPKQVAARIRRFLANAAAYRVKQRKVLSV